MVKDDTIENDFLKKKNVNKAVSILKEQSKWLDKRPWFNFSAFVRKKFGEYLEQLDTERIEKELNKNRESEG